MFQELATYLSQYKQVTIPHIGSFYIKLQPATFDVGAKLIAPPQYLPEFLHIDVVPQHQLHFLSISANVQMEQAREKLDVFGKELEITLQQQVFLWQGLGKLEKTNARLIFHPENISLNGFKPIPAQKVLRKNVQHAVLRGEQEVLSASFYDEEKKIIPKRSIAIVAGWILVVLAAAFIIFYLYQHRSDLTFSGTNAKVVPSTAFPTHK